MAYLIRTKNNPKAPLTKYMGAFMPLRIFTSLAIYCLANGVTKSAVMETIFREWIAKNFTLDIEADCYKQIAVKMHVRYEELSFSRRSLTYSIFCEDLTKEFELKGLYHGNIKCIITELDNIHFKK